MKRDEAILLLFKLIGAAIFISVCWLTTYESTRIRKGPKYVDYNTSTLNPEIRYKAERRIRLAEANNWWNYSNKYGISNGDFVCSAISIIIIFGIPFGLFSLLIWLTQ